MKKQLILTLLVLTTSLFAVAEADNKEIELVVETRILDFDPVPGMKSLQTIKVNFDDRSIISGYETGTTYGIDSARDDFEVTKQTFLEPGKASFSVKGSTASGVLVMPNIDYKFDFVLKSNGTLKIKGCHDGYPSYKISTDGRTRYFFKHDSVRLYRLFGDCDVDVDQYTP